MGVFSLEELHRRRVAGEFSGSDVVWCEGMVQWQSLDLVLQQKLPGAFRPIRRAAQKSKISPVLLAVVVVMLLFFACGLVFLAVAFAKYAHRIQRTIATASQAAGPERNATAMALASRPIPWNTNTLTQAAVRDRDREFRERQWVEGYKLRGDHNTSCDALCLGLVQNWIAYNYGGTYDTNLPPLPELSARLAADPDCTDPLVLAAAAENSVELHEAVRRFDRAVKGFEQSKHHGYPKFYAATVLANDLNQMHRDSGRIAALDSQALQYLREALTDGSVKPADQEEIGEILLEGYGSWFFWRNQPTVVSMVQNQGRDFEWLALVLQGEQEINEAWKIRGGGYANTVSALGWQGFSEHLNTADRCLTRAWKLDPNRPLAPCRMIYVSLGNSDLSDMRLWFDRTLAAQVDFDKAWSDFRWGLRPRWYGDTDAMLALGVAALNTHHFETDVPRKLLDSIYDVESEYDLPPGQHIYGNPEIWPHLQEMYEGYISEPSQAYSLNYWRGTYAATAYLAGKYEVAAEQLKELGWQPDPANLKNWGRDLSLMTLEVAARTGPQSAAVAAAESSRDERDTASALKQYHDLSGLAGLDDRTKAFVQDRLTTLGIEKQLENREWVDYLPTDTNMTGWFVERGHCTVNPDGSLDVHSDANGHLLYSRARLGRDFEARGQFEVQRTSDKSFQAGLVMGLPQFNFYNWYAFRVKRNQDEGDVASFSLQWTANQQSARAALDNFTNTFYFRFQNGKVSASVNDQEVLKEVAPPQEIAVATNEFLLGVGAYNDSNDTVIRYRKLQVRSLASP